MLLPAVLTAAALAAGGPAVDATPAAAPRIIMFYGGELGDQRVYMVDWYENLAFMLATLDSLTTVPPEYRGGRHVDIAMYWHGPTWEAHARDTMLLKTLRPEQGQKSRLYLSTPASPAFIESVGFIKYRVVSDSARLILRKYAVPVDAEQASRSIIPSHELASMHAAAVAAWAHTPLARGQRVIPYHFSSIPARSPLPLVAPLFDTTAWHEVGLDPGTGLVAIEATPTATERRLIEDSVFARTGRRLLYLTDEMLQELRGGPPGIGFSKAFHDRFPESGGYLTFSRASVDRSVTVASLAVSFSCGGRCGGGSNHLLRRTPSGWQPAAKGSISWVH